MTEENGNLPKLFTPVKLGDFELPHRVVFAPMTRFRADKTTAVPKPIVAEYYEQRASGAGFLVTESVSIHADAASLEGCPGIYSEEQVAEWSKVSKRVHTKGGKIFMQLWHVGRTVPSALIPGKKQAVSSSATPIKMEQTSYTDACGGVVPEGEVPRALSVEEIKEIVGQFRKAAANAMRAGFDGIEIKGAGGYLIEQFLKDNCNKRQDSYGGSIENRCRFALEIMEAISKEIGESKTAIRLSPFGTFNDMNDSNPVALFTHLLRELSRKHPNLAYVHLSDDFGCSPEEEKLLYELRKEWTGVCIINRGGNTRDKAIEDVESGRVDLIAFGRLFMANPDLPERLEKNLPLNSIDYSTIYGRDAAGYTDYPFYTPSG